MTEVTIISNAEITEVYKGKEAEDLANAPAGKLDEIAPKVAEVMKKRLGVDDFNITKVKMFVNENAPEPEPEKVIENEKM